MTKNALKMTILSLFNNTQPKISGLENTEEKFDLRYKGVAVDLGHTGYL